jgi:RNA polymerase sigma-70 factor (TIGR02943 family)
MNDGAALDPDTWVDRHGDSLFRFAVLRVKDPEIASDLVQETFLAALRVRDNYSGASSVRSWLTAILKHKIVDRLRKTGREQRFREAKAKNDETEGMFDRRGRWRTPPRNWRGDPIIECERDEFWQVLGRCLSKLPAHLADAFLERELEGLSREVISQNLGITPENLSVRLFRARLLLRCCLEDRWFHGRDTTRDHPREMTRAARRSEFIERR